MFIRDFENAGSFIAISYVARDDKKITLAELTKIGIVHSANYQDAFLQFHRKSKKYWLDQIDDHSSDSNAKLFPRRMNRVRSAYAKAEKVIALITEDDAKYLDHLNTKCQLWLTEYKYHVSDIYFIWSLIAKFKNLMEHPTTYITNPYAYWSRLWILQEMMEANEVEYHYIDKKKGGLKKQGAKHIEILEKMIYEHYLVDPENAEAYDISTFLSRFVPGKRIMAQREGGPNHPEPYTKYVVRSLHHFNLYARDEKHVKLALAYLTIWSNISLDTECDEKQIKDVNGKCLITQWFNKAGYYLLAGDSANAEGPTWAWPATITATFEHCQNGWKSTVASAENSSGPHSPISFKNYVDGQSDDILIGKGGMKLFGMGHFLGHSQNINEVFPFTTEFCLNKKTYCLRTKDGSLISFSLT